jgi:hypothetical protein
MPGLFEFINLGIKKFRPAPFQGGNEVKNALKFMSIGLVMVVLLMSQWSVNESRAEAATIAEDKVSWMNTSATVQKHYSPGPTGSETGATSSASFWLRDSALDTTKTASTTWYFNNNYGSDIGIDSEFTLFSASTTPNINGSTTCIAYNGATCGGILNGGTVASSTSTFSTTNTASTSLSGITVTSSATGTTNTFSELVGWNKDNAVFKNKSAINGSSTVVAVYSYNVVDTYAGSSAGNKVAKVTSTSDAEGEWVSITQVTAPGSLSTDDEADYYNGSIVISKDAGSTTSGDGAVWVQDGDTLTVSYYGCGTSCTDAVTSTAVTSSATATIDFAVPTISVVGPVDGTITNDKTPEFTYTVADAASGFTATAPLTYVSSFVNNCKALSTEYSYADLGSKSMTITVALTPGTNWTTAATGTCDGAGSRTGGGFGVDGSTVTTTTTGTWHGSSTNYKIVVSDIAGNQKTITGSSANFTIDSTAPNMTSAVTGKKYSADKDTVAPYTLTGNDANDNFTVKVVFDESLGASSVETTDFTVDGVVPATVTLGGKDEFTDRLVYLGMENEIVHNSKPVVKLVGAVTDRVGNSLNDKPSGVSTGTDNSGSATDGIADKVTATDGVKPTISGAALDVDIIKKAGSSVLTFNSDENMKDNSNTIAGVCTCGVVLGGGSAGTASSTKLAVSLTSPTAGKATFKQATFSATGIYGIVINGKDVNNNVGNSGGTKVTSEDVSSQWSASTTAGTSKAVKLKKWPLADHDGDGTLHDGVSVTVNGVASVVNMSGSPIDWSEAETLTMTFDDAISNTDTVKITYYYVAAAQVVEVDISKPTVSSFSPADGSSSQNRRPMIGVTWDEDEYAGDTYTTVTLTKAELTDPAGTKTDVLANMNTSDNKNFFYRPTADLAYGDFVLTVSAKDTAGNEQVNKTGRFTVKARALTKVALLPGWNLISMPGTPTNTAINTVMDSAPKVETVLTYDPTVAGGWLSAVRNSSGDLAGTLGAVDAARAYWVYTTNNDPIKVDIPGYDGGAQQLPPAIALVKGWNMVPAVSITGSAIGATLDSDTYFTGLSWTRAYGFNTTTDAYSSFIPTTAADTSVVIGKGYWLFLSKAGTLVP